ncbi:hypothetical protein, partial [Klebsiella michiganensis]|uniref:hypothetical protein n=1 Tax=Klebsiella michiganensis TaxID=1134687 RepID=UPI00094159C3
LMMSLWDALRMNMMISYQELVRTFPSSFNARDISDRPSSTLERACFNAEIASSIALKARFNLLFVSNL